MTRLLALAAVASLHAAGHQQQQDAAIQAHHLRNDDVGAGHPGEEAASGKHLGQRAAGASIGTTKALLTSRTLREALHHEGPELLDEAEVQVGHSISLRQQGKLQGQPDDKEASSTGCWICLAVLVFFCCCGSRPGLTNTLASLATLVVLIYIFASGVFGRWWKGEKVKTPCLVICIWAFIQLVCLCLMSCIAGMFVAGAAGVAMKLSSIQNATVREVRKQFDDMESCLSTEQRAYFTSAEFKKKCDDLFEKADLDKNGVLTLEELQSAALSAVNGVERMRCDPFFVSAFDTNKNSKIEKAEFAEMMKYFEMRYGV
mmetsp:Transcript_38417/g.86589  ORF Transcript_38417/g.86589 Transcript_38417/m.86589 type:complete len:316 (-) Transcript_38417:231-1178(-)|eukprot:CAMPEP_0197901624 /NCGR_PEP_ID=MMETSP1439-20131203/51531_1 /TAXON_ID=66791 /ORGANISM="Gonyaulax spinifera, Strain CCMP409" /LENGTH=315 /DNA_ID=CAMNT_0043522603 /DNA_START=108 /DNA_END=1055 /DNA_ORIENTATION=-